MTRGGASANSQPLRCRAAWLPSGPTESRPCIHERLIERSRLRESSVMTLSRITQNIFWNWSGRILEAVVGFFVMPYLIIRLGDTSYGLWGVISAMSGYFGILDLGTCGSIGRYVALYRAKNDQPQVNATFSTALVLMLFLGAVGLSGMTLSQLVFFRIFEVPPEQMSDARWA